MSKIDSAKPLLGAHLSITGGRDRVFDRAKELGCSVVQLFTHNPRQWAVPVLVEAEIVLFKQKQAESGIISAAHASYLINLVSENPIVREKSRELFTIEIRLATTLDLPYLILHPGNAGKALITQAITEVAEIIDRAIIEAGESKLTVLLETTSGGSGLLGSTFEELRDIKAASRFPERVGVCFDTCHVFTSGYDMRTKTSYEETLSRFDSVCGLGNIRFIHMNDSKGELGSRKDRHEHIGKGTIGLDAFELFMNDPRFAGTAKCIETPKGKTAEWDRMNLAVLRGLEGKRNR
jgi:deoxyribonuclease-4